MPFESFGFTIFLAVNESSINYLSNLQQLHIVIITLNNQEVLTV